MNTAPTGAENILDALTTKRRYWPLVAYFALGTSLYVFLLIPFCSFWQQPESDRSIPIAWMSIVYVVGFTVGAIWDLVATISRWRVKILEHGLCFTGLLNDQSVILWEEIEFLDIRGTVLILQTKDKRYHYMSILPYVDRQTLFCFLLKMLSPKSQVSAKFKQLYELSL